MREFSSIVCLDMNGLSFHRFLRKVQDETSLAKLSTTIGQESLFRAEKLTHDISTVAFRS